METNNKPKEPWEEEFDKEFYEGIYGLAESDGEYYDQSDRMKTFICYLLKKQRYAEEEEISNSSLIAYSFTKELEERYSYARSKAFNQATEAAKLMADLAKQYFEEHYPDLEFRFEAVVAKCYKTNSDIMLIDTFELVLNAIFPKKSMKENMDLLYEFEKYLWKHGLKYMSPFADIKVITSKGEAK